MFYRPADGHGLPHNPFKAVVSPRPIAWISTRGNAGTDNLSPYSFFNAMSDQPPQVVFGSNGDKADRDGAMDVAKELRQMLHMGAARDWDPPVLMATSAKAEGVEEVWAAIREHRDGAEASGALAAKRRAKAGGEGRIRTFEGAGPTDLQSAAFDRFATSPALP